MGLVIITALRSEDPSAAGFLHSFLTVAGYSLNGTAAVFCLYRQIAKGWIDFEKGCCYHGLGQ